MCFRSPTPLQHNVDGPSKIFSDLNVSSIAYCSRYLGRVVGRSTRYVLSIDVVPSGGDPETSGMGFVGSYTIASISVHCFL